MAKGRKISVVGAGAVGTAVAYAALIRQVANEIALYDINTPKVEAEAADLAHGSHFTGWPHVSGSSDIAVTSGSDIVVITAGAKQNPGQSRLELVRDNARILKAMIPKLVEASPDAIFILVTNPCDVLTMVAQRISGLPTSRVISSGTVLDSSRLRRLIADRARISTASVHASIIGEHGDSEFPMWSVARIGAVPIADYRVNGHQVFPPDVLDDLAHQVMTSAYKVIAGKGATNFAIGLSDAGLDVDPESGDIAWVTIDEDSLGTRLTNGDVDAVMGSDPAPLLPVLNGTARLLASNDAEPFCCSVALNGDFVKDSPEQARALTEAWFKGSDYLAADEAHLDEIAKIEVDNNYVAADLDVVKKLLRTYGWKASAVDFRAAIEPGIEDFKGTGFIRADVTAAELADAVFADLGITR